MTQPEFELLAERYGDLPPETRRMLEELRRDEVAFLQNLIRGNGFGTVGKFLRPGGRGCDRPVIGLPC